MLEVSASAVFPKVGQNLYHHKTSKKYYALFKRGGKQMRKGSQTTGRKLADRRLTEQRGKVARLSIVNGASKPTFKKLATKWLDKHQSGIDSHRKEG